ncbi:MAG: FecR domain-containing protein, partial [Marinomonas sp.]
MLRKFVQLIVIALLCASGTAYAQTPGWVLSEKRGTVNVQRAGISKAAISGGTLRAGDVISTGKKSRAVLVRGGEYVVISPNSRLRIAKPKTRNGVVQFFEEIGSVLFRIDKKSTPHFGVDTPYLAAVVKGTTFSVTVSESGTAVQVTEGAVQVATRDGGATQLLSPGMIGMVESSQQFRLNITGPENRVIDSPNAPAGSKATPKPMSEAKLVSIASKSFDGTISKAAVSKPVSLAKATGGMISGTVSALKPSAPRANSSSAIAGAKSAKPVVAIQNVLATNANSAANTSGNSNSNASGSTTGSNGNSASAPGAALIASSQAVAAPRQNAITNAIANAAANSAVNSSGNAGAIASGAVTPGNAASNPISSGAITPGLVNSNAGGSVIQPGNSGGNSNAGGNTVDNTNANMGASNSAGAGNGNASAISNAGANANANANAGANSNAGGNGIGNVLDDSVTSGGSAMSGGSAANGNNNSNAGGNGNGNSGQNNGQPLNYGGDQPDGTCAGVPNCASGPNPNASGNANANSGGNGIENSGSDANASVEGNANANANAN